MTIPRDVPKQSAVAECVGLDMPTLRMSSKSKLRPSTGPSNVGTRKTSFMLGHDGRNALGELIAMWNFPSQGEAVTHALLYLLHQSKADAVSRLPLAQE